MLPDGTKINSGGDAKYPIDVELPEPDDCEKIIFPPSSKLQPDEYEHNDNKHALVLIFASKLDEQNKETVAKKFTDLGYSVNDEFTKQGTVLNSLNDVAQRDFSDKSCLIIFFMGTVKVEDMLVLDNDTTYIHIKDVWSKFTADKCPSLKNKPKIFIFQGCQAIERIMIAQGMNEDSVPDSRYDVPSEADILVIFKRIDAPENRRTFIHSLCNNISKFGLRDDIISLVTRTTEDNEKRPLVISTLTRKFYVIHSPFRGYHYDLNKIFEVILNALQDLQKLQEATKSVKQIGNTTQ